MAGKEAVQFNMDIQ